jgi:hypothetical protein
MFLTPMREQSIVGISACPSQALQFFPRQGEIVSGPPLKPLLSSRVETNCVFVRSEQLVARLAVHNILYQQ